MSNTTLPQISELVNTLTDIRNLAYWGLVSDNAETNGWIERAAYALTLRLTEGVTPEEARTEAHNWIVKMQERYGSNV